VTNKAAASARSAVANDFIVKRMDGDKVSPSAYLCALQMAAEIHGYIRPAVRRSPRIINANICTLNCTDQTLYSQSLDCNTIRESVQA
jgi:hypothetical protein